MEFPKYDLQNLTVFMISLVLLPNVVVLIMLNPVRWSNAAVKDLEEGMNHN